MNGGAGRGARLRTFVMLALPALLYYPAQWVLYTVRPPSALATVAELVSISAFFSPLLFALMLVVWRSYSPATRRDRIAALALIVWVGLMALQAVPIISWLTGVG